MMQLMGGGRQSGGCYQRQQTVTAHRSIVFRIPSSSSSWLVSLTHVLLGIIILTTTSAVSGLDLTDSSEYKQVLKELLSELKVPDISISTRKHDYHSHSQQPSSDSSTEQFLPESLFVRFLESRLTLNPPIPSTKLAEDLVRALGRCIQTDSRCSLLMGNLYFQGLVPPGLLHPDDPSKNITRALGLWRYSASKGNPDTQYKLGLIFSTFYNAPSFSIDPVSLSNLLKSHHQQLEASMSDDVHSHNEQIHQSDRIHLSPPFRIPADLHDAPHLQAFQNDSPPSTLFSLSEFDSFINHLTSDLSHATDLLFHTMEVLDLEDHHYELELLQSWIQRQMVQKPSSASHTTQSACHRESIDGGNDGCSTSNAFPQELENQSELKSFPLLKRESLALLYLYSAAQGGHIGAQLALGFRHLYGLGVPKRCTAGATYYLHVAREVAQVSAAGIPPVAEIVRLDLDSIAAEESHYGAGRPSSIRMQSHVADLQQHLADAGHPKVQTAVGKKYLLGIDGCQQDNQLAIYYFKQAALRGFRDAISWLGYLITLGIGVEKNYDLAMKLFLLVVSSSPTQNDPMAHNGLGYLYFVGTPSVAPNIEKAVHHFTLSASKEFPDAQYNLAALYLTGTGVDQSFGKSLKYLSTAVEQGHSSAMYLLGVMHFNGLGTLRDCSIAAGLFKRVAERHYWVAEHLKKAYTLQAHNHQDESAFVYWELAESGIEFVQSNLAELLDGGGQPLAVQPHHIGNRSLGLIRSLASYLPGIRNKIVTPTALFSLDHRPSLGVNRAFAHRYWDLAALQRSSHALIRLGDYAYFGWGVEPASHHSRKSLKYLIELNDDILDEEDQIFIDTDGHLMDGWGSPRRQHDLYQRRSKHQYQEAYYFYDRASVPQRPQIATVKQNKPHMIRAEYLLSQMHESGLGVPQDLRVAKRHLNRITELDPDGSVWLVKISVLLLRLKAIGLHLHNHSILKTLRSDHRILFAFFNLFVVLLLQFTRPFVVAARNNTHSHSD